MVLSAAAEPMASPGKGLCEILKVFGPRFLYHTKYSIERLFKLAAVCLMVGV